MLRAILITGVVGAISIDAYLIITVSGIFRRVSATVMMQWDASNLLGAAAYQGGIGTVVLGTVLHLIVSTVWAAIFIAVYLRNAEVANHPVVAGAVFGVVVWAVMRYVIVPLGQATIPPSTAVGLANNIVAHVLFFGVPVALCCAQVVRVRVPALSP